MAGSKAVGRHEPDRELARLLLTADGADLDYAALARKHGALATRTTREELERSRTPLSSYEPNLDGSLSSVPRKHLNTIGCAMRPDLSPDQAQAWVDAEMIKLSDLAPHVVAKATERALHVAFEFPSQVEAKVRELAQEHMDRINGAIGRARAVERAIHEALNPRPALPEPEPLRPGEKVVDDALVHKLQRDPTGMGQAVVSLGRSKGWITDDQLLPIDDPTITQEAPSHVE